MTLIERLQADHPGKAVLVEQVYEPGYGKLNTYLRIGETLLVIHYGKDELERIPLDSPLGQGLYRQLRFRLGLTDVRT